MRSSLLVVLMSLAFAWPLIADDKSSVDQKLDALEEQLRALGFSEEEIKEAVEKARKKNYGSLCGTTTERVAVFCFVFLFKV